MEFFSLPLSQTRQAIICTFWGVLWLLVDRLNPLLRRFGKAPKGQHKFLYLTRLIIMETKKCAHATWNDTSLDKSAGSAQQY
jgi:hypothetical protein